MEAVSYPSVLSASQLLNADHAQVKSLCEVLVESYHQQDWFVVRAAFNRLEAALLAHISAEDDWLLPGYLLVAPNEASALERDHRGFRRQLAEIGVGIELHSVSARVVLDLVGQLREHAIREDHTLYPWADGALDPSVAASLREHLEARAAT